MIKKLSLLATAFLVLTGTAIADQVTTYKVNVNNNTPSGSDVYLTAASEMSGCKVFWPTSELPINGTTPFKLECDGTLPPALTLSFITQPIHNSQGQTCWTSYSSSQFISVSTTNVALYPTFNSQYICQSSGKIPHILPNHPAPPTN